MQSKNSLRSRKKHKAYKSKDKMPLVLTDGDLDEIEEKLQEVIIE